jgi:hypothetical protein
MVVFGRAATSRTKTPGDARMSKSDYKRLVKLAKTGASRMTGEDRERQRRSFAYGNGAIENGAITRKSVDKAAEKLAQTRKRNR